MKLPHNKPWVVIEWLDANATQTVFYQEHEIPHKASLAFTGGWLLREDDLGVTIANEYFDDGNWRGTTFVPKGMIQAVHRTASRKRKGPQ